MRYDSRVKIYCSGIGGIGLSAYASLQRAAGHEVTAIAEVLPRAEDEVVIDLAAREGCILLTEPSNQISREA